MIRVEHALISVYDKSGILSFAKGLSNLGVKITSSGGTAQLLEEGGLRVRRVSDLTGFPELLDGRVKTLHPKIHAAILAKRIERHLSELKTYDIECIDLVVVNLYPFREMVLGEKDLEVIIENIDIGGVALLRAAAKNFKYVITITNPAYYEEVLRGLRENNCYLPEELSLRLAREAFSITASYDTLIHQYFMNLTQEYFPLTLNLTYEKQQDLRYGENPHQRASLYKELLSDGSLCEARKLQGKELSFNNILDVNAVVEILQEFEEVCCAVVVKHTNPCGVAIGDDLCETYRRAREVDAVSAFGGVVGLNRVVDRETALELTSTFIEVVIAPGYEENAKEILQRKEGMRVLEMPNLERGRKRFDIKRVSGGILLQEEDRDKIELADIRFVSARKPTEDEMRALFFAWKVVKHVKSNAVVLANKREVRGVGAGQMSRVDAVRVALSKASDKAKGTALASDAFFPFRDAVDEAAAAGVTAIIQPGGSIRDGEVIEAANQHNLAMIFTGRRHFKH